MRVIGGTARGRPLKAKLPSTVRPTTDYAREAIFSMLESRGGLVDLVVADLYCGSGAMGIEAMSRGAAKVYFVDGDPACLAAAKANLEPLQLRGRGGLRARDAAGLVAAGRPRPRARRSALRAAGPGERCCTASWRSASSSRTIATWTPPRWLDRHQNQAIRHYARNDVGTGRRGTSDGWSHPRLL